MTDEIRNGDVLAVHTITKWYKPQTWLSARIRQTTKSEWNHVALIVENGDGQYDVVEALFLGGVVRRSLMVYADAAKYRVAIYRPREHVFVVSPAVIGQDRVAEWAIRQVGAAYSWLNILKIRALQVLFRNDLVGKIQIPGMSVEPGFICSGLVTRAWWQVGVTLGGEFADPQTVIEHCERRVL